MGSYHMRGISCSILSNTTSHWYSKHLLIPFGLGREEIGPNMWTQRRRENSTKYIVDCLFYVIDCIVSYG